MFCLFISGQAVKRCPCHCLHALFFTCLVLFLGSFTFKMAATAALKYLLPTEKICVQLGLRKDPDAGKYWRQEKRMTEDKMDVITNSKDVSLSKLQELVIDREAWRAAVHGVSKSGTRLNWLNWSFPGGTSGKEPTCQCRRHKRQGFTLWVGKIPWRRAWQPTPVFLPGESHGQRSLAGCSPQSHIQSDRTEATYHARMQCSFKWELQSLNRNTHKTRLCTDQLTKVLWSVGHRNLALYFP